MIETPARSLVKAITYRILSSTVTAAIAYALTGSIRVSLSLGMLEVGKLALYYGHERLWSKYITSQNHSDN